MTNTITRFAVFGFLHLAPLAAWLHCRRQQAWVVHLGFILGKRVGEYLETVEPSQAAELAVVQPLDDAEKGWLGSRDGSVIPWPSNWVKFWNGPEQDFFPADGEDELRCADDDESDDEREARERREEEEYYADLAELEADERSRDLHR
jgi:hypothetical protein